MLCLADVIRELDPEVDWSVAGTGTTDQVLGYVEERLRNESKNTAIRITTPTTTFCHSV